MTGVEVKCRACGTEFTVSVEKCGKHTHCIKCGKINHVPLPGVGEGKEFGDFMLKRRLGKGGMGEVWLAEQTALSRLAAIKILPPSMAQDDDYRERFLREAKIAGQLHHPNIVAAFSAGMINELYFLASRYIDGINLIDSLTINKMIQEKEALGIALQIADALGYAWDKFKIIHRDIKPENIMMHEAGKPMLLDLGIAKQIENDEPGLTQVGIIIGTPDYISPEQASGDENIDFRTDIYSLGATIYHLVTGQQPFGSGVSHVVLARVLTDDLVPPIEVNPDISPATSALIMKMMARVPAERQQNWDEVKKDIEGALQGKQPKGSKKVVKPETSDSAVLENIDISIVRKDSESIADRRAKTSVHTHEDVDVDDLENTVTMYIDEDIDDPVVLRLKEPGNVIIDKSIDGDNQIIPPDAPHRPALLEDKKLLLLVTLSILFILVCVAILILLLK